MDQVKLTKLDIAADFLGAFLAIQHQDAYSVVKDRLKAAVDMIFGSTHSNFLSLERLGGFRVLRGENILNSCFQYKVKDSDGPLLFIVKFYDKILDLAGREATHICGSRINDIIGSKHHIDDFNKRVGEA